MFCDSYVLCSLFFVHVSIALKVGINRFTVRFDIHMFYCIFLELFVKWYKIVVIVIGGFVGGIECSISCQLRASPV